MDLCLAFAFLLAPDIRYREKMESIHSMASSPVKYARSNTTEPRPDDHQSSSCSQDRSSSVKLMHNILNYVGNRRIVVRVSSQSTNDNSPKAREARKKMIEDMNPEVKAAYEKMRFYKFYPVSTPTHLTLTVASSEVSYTDVLKHVGVGSGERRKSNEKQHCNGGNLQLVETIHHLGHGFN
ncbi:hypothetical protein FCM35_KLT19084 [Carex littledalei]|uniref:Uncharacterized protein n=1 Tax=Carex littledalei TaxID=544730 RepID=A0A833RBA6_9POAL|nr:hypothetical protein FCM35_KLT19084 [Carex littledalei]